MKLKPLFIAPWGFVTWLLFEVVVFMPLYLIGAIFFPVAYYFVPLTQGDSRLYPGKKCVNFASPLIDAWLGNWEDGLCPAWWQEAKGSDGLRAMWSWFLRNPVTNLRFMPVVSFKPDPSKVGHIGADVMPEDGQPGWFLAWHGLYAGFRWQTKSWGVWFGWKVHPEDAQGFKENDYRQWGVGTSAQIMRF